MLVRQGKYGTLAKQGRLRHSSDVIVLNHVVTSYTRYVVADRRPSVLGNWTCYPRCDVDVLFAQSDKDLKSRPGSSSGPRCPWPPQPSRSSPASSTPPVSSTPERPVVFLSLCVLASCLAALARACVDPRAIACERTAAGQEFIIRGGELESARCVATFIVTYFFTTSSAVWWTVFTLSWFLASGRKWGREAIQSYASYFHLAAWSLPAAQTIAVLALRKVDGDELTGMCSVGNQDSTALFVFFLVPLGIYFVIGTVLVISGFVALSQVRRNLRRDRPEGVVTDIRKLEKLMVKVGLFSGVYMVAQSCVIGCLVLRATQQRWLD